MKNSKDNLGERMKGYENVNRNYLIPRSYTIIRIDGKAFHTYTKGMQRPFDMDFIDDMDKTAKYLCSKIMGAKFAFVQSDEISILLTDFDTLETQGWFDGNIQKVVSVSASMATAKFNQLRMKRWLEYELYFNHNAGNNEQPNVIINETDFLEHLPKLAEFDSRVFQLPTITEVENYFIWRQQDTVRNSIQSVAQSLYSSKELHEKNTNQLQELIFQKGINWNDYDAKLKRGRMIIKQTLVDGVDLRKIPNQELPLEQTKVRTNWISEGSEIFTQNRNYINFFIPKNT